MAVFGKIMAIIIPEFILASSESLLTWRLRITLWKMLHTDYWKKKRRVHSGWPEKLRDEHLTYPFGPSCTFVVKAIVSHLRCQSYISVFGDLGINIRDAFPVLLPFRSRHCKYGFLQWFSSGHFHLKPSEFWVTLPIGHSFFFFF